MVEDIVGCKWSLGVIQVVRANVTRPGAMQRELDGISTKVLNERLTKMVRYGILSKEIFPEIPPHVEYHLTSFGEQFSKILDQINTLQEQQTKDDSRISD